MSFSRPGAWRWLVVALGTVAAILLAYQVPYVCSVSLGTIRDGPFVEGFLERTGTPEYSFRWSQEASTILLPGVAWRQDQELMLRLAPGLRPPDAPSPEVDVLANGTEVARFEIAPGFRNYRIPLRSEVLTTTGVLRVELNVPPFPWDGRDLGVVVEKVRLRPSDGAGRTVALPPIPLTLAWILNGLLWLALVLQTPFGRRRSWLWAAVVGGEAGLALCMALAREWTALLTAHACGALALGNALAWQWPRWREQARTGERAPLRFLHTLGVANEAWRTRLEAGIIALVATHFALTVLWPLREWGPKDFRLYHAAGTLWVEGGDYYDVQAVRSRFGGDVPDKTGFAFTNPPSAAAVYAPLARLPLARATAVWRVLNVGFILVAGLLMWASTRPSTDTPPSPVWLTLLLCGSEPLRITLRMGQVGLLVLLLLAACLWGIARRRPLLAGVSLAAAAAVKVLPGFPLLYFVWRRDWRTTGAAVASGALLLAGLLAFGGVGPWQTFLFRVLPAVSSPAAYFGNQSVQGFLERLAGEPAPMQARFNFTFALPGDAPHPATRVVGYGVALGALALTAWWMRRHPADDPLHRTLELATTVPLMLLAAPLVWEFYLTWLIPTIHVLLVVLSSRSLTARGQVGVAGTLAVSWALMQLDTTDTYRLPGWPVPLMSLGLYAVVLVFGCSLYLLRQTSRVSASRAEPRDADPAPTVSKAHLVG
jgi:hypothetical protein